MYAAVFEMVTTVKDAPEQIKPFIMFDARRRKIELGDDDKVAILRIDTSMSYIPVPLTVGLSIEDVENELKEIEAELNPGAKHTLSQLLNDQ